MTGLTATDQFCGAGGSSLGAAIAGVELRLGLNHSKLAIETHNTNFPNADHDCTDISACDPRRYPSTDILITSPECTNHTLAKGARRKPIRAPSLLDEEPLRDDLAERSRATMWDVIRFTEFHGYKAIIVENVVDAFWWGPKRPGFKMGDGALFTAWLQAMDALGYAHEIVFLNSMFAPPTPQSRDRMYVVFWQKGIRTPDLRFDVTAWCPSCERVVEAQQAWKKPGARVWGKYGAQYLYTCPECRTRATPGAYPAATAIDFDLPTQRIGDRKWPLATATRSRIRRGVELYGPEALAFRTLHDGSARPLTVPLVTQTGRQDLALLLPVAGNRSERRPGSRVRSSEEPFATFTTQAERALVVPLRRNGVATDAASEALPTVCASGNHHALVVSQMAHNVPRNADSDPLHPVTTGGKLALVVAKGGGSMPRPSDDPLPTVTGIPQLRVLEAPEGAFVMRNNTARGDQGQMSTPVDEPLRTLTTNGHQSLVVPYYSNGEAVPASEPLGTVTTRERHALVDIEDFIDDCTFRMLQPQEIARAMVMHEHIDGSPYIVLGNKRERVEQYGNAVTPPVMRLLVERVVEAIG